VVDIFKILNMTSVCVVGLEELEQEFSPEEIEESEYVECTQVETVESPFSYLLANMLQGGGRNRRDMVSRGELDPRSNPTIENGLLCGQDFYALREQCAQSGELFVDPEFPPDNQSLYFSDRIPYDFEWRRPIELVDNPELFVGGASRFDINQGELGDCWLLAALANLTMNKRLLFNVVPKDQSFSEEYAGIFHFRFWQYGEWVDVVVDDYLPTRDGKLMFMHSDSNSEFWTALLEKAYAKLHGSYEALKGGSTAEAMVDFTGGCSEMFTLKDPDVPKDLYTMMLKAYERGSLMGCSIEPDPRVLEAKTSVGLVRGHAYSVTKVVKVDIQTPRFSGKIPLVRIRNPWGNETEWNGPWSDGSPEWRYVPDEEKENIGLSFDSDGEFFMSYKDFMKYWDQLEICHLSADSFEDARHKAKWSVATFHGEWIAGQTAGGCRNNIQSFGLNPQYWITVTDPDEDEDNLCTVVISLMQKGRRALRDEGLDMLTIGFGIYYVRNPNNTPRPLDTDFFRYNKSIGRSKNFINLREVTVRFKFPPGTYVIIPSTFSPGESGEFIIRVFSEKPHSAEQA